MTVIFLLIVIVALLYRHRLGSDYTLGLLVLIGAFTWLAIEIHLLRIAGSLFALALEHWVEIVMAFSASVLLAVPIAMMYEVLRDPIGGRALRSKPGRAR